MGIEQYDRLAPLFEYPSEGYVDRVKVSRDFVAEAFPEAVCWLDDFIRYLPETLRDQRELFTRSFDVQAITTLDVGYVLFGEDYKRGELLANLMKEHRLAGNDCGTELPDHMPNLLRLLPKMEDRELAEELVQEIIVPSLRKMIAEFDAPLMAKKDAAFQKTHKTVIDANPEFRLVYLNVLKGFYAILDQDFDVTRKPLIEKTSDFLKSLYTEMTIENQDGKMRLPTW